MAAERNNKWQQKQGDRLHGVTKDPGGNKRKFPSGQQDAARQEDRSYYSTRLCVRNLPKNVKEDGVRTFLLAGLDGCGIDDGDVRVTDCRVMTKGRESLAFVGVSSSEGADRILDRRHRTFFGTHRVVVERAYKRQRPQEEEPPVSTEAEERTCDRSPGKGSAAPQRSANVLLAAAASSLTMSKNKFWANEEGAAAAPPSLEPTKNDDDDDDSSAGASSHDSEEDASIDDASSASDATPPQHGSKTSDLDFLKSIRRRADDLEQEEEEEEPESAASEDDSDGSDDGQEAAADPDKSPSDEVTDAPENSERPQPNAPPASSSSAPQATNRVFVRNLPFTATEEDLAAYFGSVAGCTVVDCHVPVTDQKRSKGFAFVTFSRPKEVSAAIAQLDGCDFQGRILHLLPAHPKQDQEDDGAASGSGPRSFKDQRIDERRAQAVGSKSSAGLASYVRADAVVDSLASRMGFQKGDILSLKDGLSSGDAAIRLALGETAVIEENRKFLERLGIDLSSLDGGSKRSNTCILVKNLPADTTEDDLMKVFGAHSAVSEGLSTQAFRLELAPSRTLAVVEYSHRNDAKSAFRRLAYRRFKNVPLYLEWAPITAEKPMLDESETNKSKLAGQESQDESTEDLIVGPTATVHVKNLNFATTEERLREFFASHVQDVRSVRVPTKVVPLKRVGGTEVESVRSQSMGYGFVEFASQDSCREVIRSLQGAILDGHALEIKPSSSKQQASSSLSSGKDKPKQPTKLIVRNVPFQATRKELLVLFGSFGQLKKVRLPKKFDGSHRGFAFVEFLTSKDALSAFKSLSSTHLYGRHLVIEWATEEEDALAK